MALKAEILTAYNLLGMNPEGVGSVSAFTTIKTPDFDQKSGVMLFLALVLFPCYNTIEFIDCIYSAVAVYKICQKIKIVESAA